MEEILTAFGIDARLIVIQIVNFAVLLGVLWYFLYEPVLNLIKKRQEKIEQGLRDAEEAAQVKSEAAEAKKTLVEEATREAEEIIARAGGYAKEREEAIVAEAEARAAALIDDAKSRGTELQAQLKRDAEDDIAKTAVLAAERILAEQSAARKK